MTFEEFKRERVQPPSYGNAPAGLIDEYQAILNQMDQAYSAGAALASDTMLALNRQATALADEISRYHPSI